MILGLIPDAPLDRVGPAGNAAGTGALIALLSADARREIERVVRTVEKIETAVNHEVETATEACKAAPNPPMDTLFTDVYADGGWAWRN